MTRGLTKRQREVLVLYANGNTQQQIAKWLGICKGTVTGILTNAYRTLGADTGQQAVAIALALGEIGIHQIHIPEQQRESPA